MERLSAELDRRDGRRVLQALVDVDRRCPRAPAAGRDADLRVGALHVGRRGAAQLLDDVDRLGRAGGPQRVALAEQPAREIDPHGPVDPGGAVGGPLPALALGGEAERLDPERLWIANEL